MDIHRCVWFLKAEKPSSEGPDPYRTTFERAGWTCRFVPVLSFNFINEATLIEKINSGDQYSGIIFTSQRAAGAIERVIASCVGEKIAAWRTLPCFSVGDATAVAASRALGRDLSSIIIGSGGDGCCLSQEIISQHKSAPFTRPLLFLCGTIRRNELPDALRSAGISFEEVHVYETQQSQTTTTTAAAPPLVDSFDLFGHPPEWIVFFSPSGVESFLSCAPGHESGSELFWDKVKPAAIGKTTAIAMLSQGAWLGPRAIAAVPNAAALLEAIQQAELNQNS